MEELNKNDLYLIDQLIYDEIRSCNWRISRRHKYQFNTKETFEKRLDELKLLQLKVKFQIIDKQEGE